MGNDYEDSYHELFFETDADHISKKFDLIIASFDHFHTLSRPEFIRKHFDDVFKLIPEAEKGSYYEMEGGRCFPMYLKGYDESHISRLPQKIEDLLAGYSGHGLNDFKVKQASMNVMDSKRFNRDAIGVFKSHGIHENLTTLYAPVHADGVNVGLICLDNFTKGSFSELSGRTLKYYAQLISSFCEHWVNQERVAQIHMEMVSALISSIEVNDPYTEGHGKRVGYYAKRIGGFFGLPKNTVSELETAGLLHDIGKIGIPTEILNKPGKLLKEEYEIIQKHPGNTKKILEKIKGLNRISEFTYCHHEHYDGTGYPRGLKGEEIPYEGQILSVADAFDAMTSNRAYRNALTPEDAAAIILSQSGKQFRPELSQAAALILPMMHYKMNHGDAADYDDHDHWKMQY